MLSDLARGFEGLSRLAPAIAVREARPLLERLARDASLQSMLPRVPARATEPAWRTLGEVDGCQVVLFVWPTGARTPIHDHTSWGIYACLSGRVVERRYARLDDGHRSGVAQLRSDWQRVWSSGEQSLLLPYAAGIHRVSNVWREPALTVHLYGPRMSEWDGRDYDPSRDWVCDRPPELEGTGWLERAA